MDPLQRGQLFGRWLGRRRRALDLTQKELARLVGCSVHTIRKFENGARRPSKPIAGAIARVTGVPENEHEAFVRFARASGSDDAGYTRRSDLERPWLPEAAMGARPTIATALAVVGAPPAATTTLVELPGTDVDNESAPPLKFVARAAELDRLKGALDQALNAHGCVMLISGEAGQGKTSIMTAFAARAQVDHPDLLTVIGTCSAYTGASDPFAPFREILAQLTGYAPSAGSLRPMDASRYARLRAFLPHSLASVVDHGPDLLGTLLPLAPLRARLREAGITPPESLGADVSGPPTRPSGGQSAVELRSEAVDVLADISTHAPLLLLLDDLQWADENSLGLLVQLARAATANRILVVGAYRTEGVATSSESISNLVHRVALDLTRLYEDVRLDLDEADTRAFLDAWIDTEPNELGRAFRDALWRQTGGQPLFTVELLRAMQQGGDLIRDGEGRWTEGPELRWDALPARVAGALGERFARLDPVARKVLTAAGIEGETFTVEVVARVLDLDPLDVARVTSHALERDHHLVDLADVTRLANGQRISRYRFRHNLIQRYVLDQLGDTERSYLHEKVAAELETLLGDDTDPLALAYHYTRAQAPALAAPYQRKAGDRALQTGALSDAIRAYQDALDAWPETDHEGRAELLHYLAMSLAQHGDDAEAERILTRLVAEYERLGDRSSHGAVRAAINLIALTAPSGAHLRKAYLEWLPFLEETQSPMLGFVSTQTAHLLIHEDNDRALALAERGIAVLEREGDQAKLAQGLRMLGSVLALTRPDRKEDALATFNRSIELARSCNAGVEVGFSLWRLALFLESLGRIDAAVERARQLMDLCRRHQLKYLEKSGRALRFRLDWLQGRWSEARVALPQLRTESEFQHLRAYVLAMAELDLARSTQAQPWLDEIGTTMSTEVELDFRVQYLREALRGAAATGNTPAAECCAADLLGALADRPSYPPRATDAVVTAAYWLAQHTEVDSHHRVGQCVRILDATAQQYGSLHARAGLHVGRGALASTEGESAAAREHYLHAADLWAEQGFPLYEAKARCAAAHLARNAGSSVEGDAQLACADNLLAGLAAQLPNGEMASSFADVRQQMIESEERLLL